MKTAAIRSPRGEWPSGYLEFFDLFNRGLYYEAHEALEEVWLPLRKGPLDHFYRGLIQLAGAFVHLSRGRLRPAGSLLSLSRGYLSEYPGRHHGLLVAEAIALIDLWRSRLEGRGDPWKRFPPPRLERPGPHAA